MTKSMITKISRTIPTGLNLSVDNDVRENNGGKKNRTASRIHIMPNSRESTVTASGFSAFVKHIDSGRWLSVSWTEIMPA